VRPDYDLSGLEVSQADLWLCFQDGAIRGEIAADQEKRLGFSLAGGNGLEEICGLFAQPVSPESIGPCPDSPWKH